MSIEFALTRAQEETRSAIRDLAVNVIRPQSMAWDLHRGVPVEFLRRFAVLAGSMGGLSSGALALPRASSVDVTSEHRSPNLSAVLAVEELAWGDAALLLCLPGPGLGGPPVRATGTAEQKERFLGIFKDLEGELHWGAYALTEPNAGSDVAGIRTSCRKVGTEWVIRGRKCYITNGARASWNVVFATVDPALGRAGHRAFVVEKGTPGFSIGRIEDKMGLRASETAELVFENCRVPKRTCSAERTPTLRRRAS